MEEFIVKLFIDYPWMGPTFAALYFASEALGTNPKIKENAVYQTVLTLMSNIFGRFYTKVEK